MLCCRYKVETHSAAIMEVSTCATGENQLQIQMAEIDAKSNLWTLEFSEEGIVKNFDALIADIEATVFTLKGVALSRFCDIIGDRLPVVAANIDCCLRVVRSMDTLQRQWLILRGVMDSPEAISIMPDELAGFVRVNGAWKELLLRTSKRNPQVRDAPTKPTVSICLMLLQVHALMAAKDSIGIEARLREYTAVLDNCLHKLDQFVDLKCKSFPRLQLMHRTDIVRLVSCGVIQHANIGVYQAAVRACFPGVSELQVLRPAAMCHVAPGSHVSFCFFLNVLYSFMCAAKRMVVGGWCRALNL